MKREGSKEVGNSIWKFMLYLLSLWLLFFILIILKADMSGLKDGISPLLMIKTNLVPVICFILILAGWIGYIIFRDKLNSSKELPVKLAECKSMNPDNMSFFAAYVIPLSCFPKGTNREVFVMFFLILIVGCIFVRTNLFYSNPTLVLMGFNIYSVCDEVSAVEKSPILKDAIVIVKGKLKSGDMIQYIGLGDNIYFAKLKS